MKKFTAGIFWDWYFLFGIFIALLGLHDAPCVLFRMKMKVAVLKQNITEKVCICFPDDRRKI